MFRGLAFILPGVIVAFLVPRAAAQEGSVEPSLQGPGPLPQQQPAEGDAVRYRTRIVGDVGGGLEAELRAASLLVALEDKPPASVRRLEARAETDRDRLDKVLRSEGYYDGTVAYRMPVEGGVRTVDLVVTPGPRYRFSGGGITYAEPVPPGAGWPLRLADIGIDEGAPARADVVLVAETALTRRLHEHGRPFARVTDRRAVVDRTSRTMTVTFRVAAGPAARFGPTRFTGLANVKESYVRRFIPWTAGQPFDQREVDKLAQQLRGTGLFDVATVTHADAVGADGRLPITVSVVEHPERSVGVGGSYSTSEGISGSVFWEHRNLFGNGEKLKGNLQAGQILQRFDLSFRVPDFRRLGQDIVSDTALIRQETDAFKETGASETLRLERKIGKAWRVGAGGTFEYSELINNEGIQGFTIVGLPVFAERNDADDLLNPTKGSRARLDMIPYHTLGNQEATFLRSEFAGSAYWSPFATFPMVLAGRARLGTLDGAETVSVPASKRFYAGGGGSIRGYGFQRVGPLDANGNPVGGRSVVEAAVEARFRVYGPIGLVTFLEAGNVYDDPLPHPFESLRVGTGLGVRYFTSIGPIRADIAVPLDKRPGDDPFQFYISIGQAF